ncbi:Undecaprenol kinase [Planctopirus ephydatiae]|uniref:Undecaprenol kinase n=1 Tax=Planctopirus ephydatiae TaxID=2528019 RepID=A0A518GT16_9PLAN|nr:diacylglycerol kinase family protein [Planctopirus ephydatiae]QDV31724.1 Undecaprenol kinase [Planctopirus ephydatiae]
MKMVRNLAGPSLTANRKASHSKGILLRQPAFLQALGHAWRGLVDVTTTQKNMQRHLAIAAVPLLLGLWLSCSLTEWCLLLLTMGLVLCCEVINTAIECTVDLASPEIHPLAGRSKDLAAGAVLLASIIAVLIGSLIFVPKLLAFIKSP